MYGTAQLQCQTEGVTYGDASSLEELEEGGAPKLGRRPPPPTMPHTPLPESGETARYANSIEGPRGQGPQRDARSVHAAAVLAVSSGSPYSPVRSRPAPARSAPFRTARSRLIQQKRSACARWRDNHRHIRRGEQDGVIPGRHFARIYRSEACAYHRLAPTSAISRGT